MSKLPADFQQRQQALDPTQSFICEAPAGSGKTELLTQRFLKLLSRVERPEQVLAITFTRKAVGEMRERIITALQNGLQPKPEEPHKITTWELASAVLQVDQQRHWQLLENPNRLQIKTFDSLCASLTTALPLECSFGAKPQISDDSEELYRRAVRNLLNSLESNEYWVEALTVLLSQLDNKYSRLEDLLIQMLARREEWLPLLKYEHTEKQIRNVLEANLQSIIADTITKAKRLIPQPFHKELIALAGFAAANLQRQNIDNPLLSCLDIDVDNVELPGAEPEDIAKWQGIVSMLLKKDNHWRASLNKNIGFPAGDNKDEKAAFKERKNHLQSIISELKSTQGVQDVLIDIRMLPAHSFNNEQWQLLYALTQVLPVLYAQLMVVFQETNSVDFSEISMKAQEALGYLDDPTQLALKMDYRIQHILVDEFQDTSSSQVELLNLLTGGWEAGDGRTIFCVGDAMQSIYGFRGANVGLFLNCREHGLKNVPLTPIKLTTNFRSQAGVVEWVNSVFQKAFPAHNDITTGAVSYSASVPFHGSRNSQSVEIHGFVDRSDYTAEANKILDIIQQTQSNSPEASIAVLVRNRNHASHIVPLLKQAGIRYRAVDLENLKDHVVIQDLMALTKALLHPADRIAWLSVLRAPWCGLSLVDLEAIANIRSSETRQLSTVLMQAEQALALSEEVDLGLNTSQPVQNDFFLSESVVCEEYAGQALTLDGKERLKRILPILKSALENRDRKLLRSWIEGTWLALGGASCVEDRAALQNADMYFELLEKWPYASALPAMDALDKAVEKLFAAPDPEADDSLQIMTIHKSKGLEFDVVIVPSLDRDSKASDTSLLMWHERLNARGELELVMAPITATGKDKHPTYLHLQQEENKKLLYESCRLLYVACTRAKKQLHLLANVKSNTKKTDELNPPSKRALLASIWDAVQLKIQRYGAEPDHPVPGGQETTPPVKPLHRLSKHWEYPQLPTGHMLDEYVPRYHYGNDSNKVDIRWHSPVARYVGTIVHRYLQIIGQAGIDHWSIDQIQQLKSQISAQLKLLGTPAADLQEAIDTVVMALSMVLQDEQAKVFLSNKHPFHACEYPITFNSKVGPKNLQIDRVYTTRQGTTWVIDYKTGTPEPGEPLNEFLNRQADMHESQLKLYQNALQQAGFEKVKLALYFPLINQWYEIDKVSAQS